MKQLILILLIVLIPTYVQAYTEQGDDALVVTVQPAQPSATERVTLSVSARGFESAQSLITWMVNGESVLRGAGKKTLTLQSLGPTGTVTRVRVTVLAPDSTLYKKELTFSAAEVDLLWNADTYTPQWYRGRALPSPESTVRVVAFPQLGSGIESNSLIYTWTKDGRTITNASGLGRSSFSFRAAARGSNTIGVTVSNQAGRVSASDSVIIPVRNPLLSAYRSDPLAGTLFHTALPRQYTLSEPELSVLIEPFFFSNPSELIYRWSAANRPLSISGPSASFRQGSDRALTEVRTNAEHPSLLLQRAEQRFLIESRGESTSL